MWLHVFIIGGIFRIRKKNCVICSTLRRTSQLPAKAPDTITKHRCLTKITHNTEHNYDRKHCHSQSSPLLPVASSFMRLPASAIKASPSLSRRKVWSPTMGAFSSFTGVAKSSRELVNDAQTTAAWNAEWNAAQWESEKCSTYGGVQVIECALNRG